MSNAIAAVVVTYRSGATIDECVARLRAAADVTEIRVVDNNSDDDTLAVVQRHAIEDARVHFIANPDNPGFATACNQGAADSNAPWLVFINPDLMVEPDTLQRLRQKAETLGGTPALLGVEQVDEHGQPDGAVRRRDPDFAAMLRSPRQGAQLAVPVDAAQPLQRVEAISGALMLMPRALFEAIGGWDAGYRLHAGRPGPVLPRARGRRGRGRGQRPAGAAPAWRIEPLAAVLRRMAQAPWPVALFPQVRSLAA